MIPNQRPHVQRYIHGMRRGWGRGRCPWAPMSSMVPSTSHTMRTRWAHATGGGDGWRGYRWGVQTPTPSWGRGGCGGCCSGCGGSGSSVHISRMQPREHMKGVWPLKLWVQTQHSFQMGCEILLNNRVVIWKLRCESGMMVKAFKILRGWGRGHNHQWLNTVNIHSKNWFNVHSVKK